MSPPPTGAGGDLVIGNFQALTDHVLDEVIHNNVGGEILEITEKTSPVDADLLLLEDSESNYLKRKIQVGNLPGGGGGGGGDIAAGRSTTWPQGISYTPPSTGAKASLQATFLRQPTTSSQDNITFYTHLDNLGNQLSPVGQTNVFWSTDSRIQARSENS